MLGTLGKEGLIATSEPVCFYIKGKKQCSLNNHCSLKGGRQVRKAVRKNGRRKEGDRALYPFHPSTTCSGPTGTRHFLLPFLISTSGTANYHFKHLFFFPDRKGVTCHWRPQKQHGITREGRIRTQFSWGVLGALLTGRVRGPSHLPT